MELRAKGMGKGHWGLGVKHGIFARGRELGDRQGDEEGSTGSCEPMSWYILVASGGPLPPGSGPWPPDPGPWPPGPGPCPPGPGPWPPDPPHPQGPI